MVGAPDFEYIEQGVAFIATIANTSLTVTDMNQFLAVRLADYKLPKQIYFLENLPKNATGKLDRAILTKMATKLTAERLLGVPPVS